MADDDEVTGMSAQDAAIDEADAVETVTFTWDDDEWTAPAFDALTSDQMEAVEAYAEAPLSVRAARTLMVEVLGREQALSFGWTGKTAAADILLVTAEVFKALSEDAWGLGKPSNRRERRSRSTTKR